MPPRPTHLPPRPPGRLVFHACALFVATAACLAVSVYILHPASALPRPTRPFSRPLGAVPSDAAASGLAAAAVAGLGTALVGSGKGAAPEGGGAQRQSAPPRTCSSPPTFVRYEPSPHELEWAALVAAAQAANATCAAVRADGERLGAMLDAVAALMSGKGAAATASAPPSHPPSPLLSSLLYTCPDTASGKPITWAEPIEPLVGLLRHPAAVPACAPPGLAPAHIEDRSYLLLRPRPPVVVVGAPSPPSTPCPPGPHKSFLFDAGANAYNTSLAWLVGAYAARGVAFDNIYAWEAALPLDATWWAAVPPALAPRLQAYGTPVGVGTAYDPLAWMEALAGPGDTVVFKLDVGAGQTERPFVDGIAGDGGRWGRAPYVLGE